MNNELQKVSDQLSRMITSARVMERVDVSYLDEILLDSEGFLKPVSASQIADVEQTHIAQWCTLNAIYQLPTIELIEWLKNAIGDRTAIEICAGKSGIGKALGIVSTDSYSQTLPELRSYFALAQVPIVEPPEYVKKMDANVAVTSYKPKVVIGSFVTQKFQEGDAENNIGSNIYGPDESDILALAETYIHVGNEITHKDKRILARPHESFSFDWVRSRAFNKDKNVIWVWNKSPKEDS